MKSLPHLTSLAAAAAVLGCTPHPAVRSQADAAPSLPPIQWSVTGDARTSYALGDVSADGRASSLRRVTPGTGFGATAAIVDAGPYRGRRVRLSAMIRAENAASGAATWLRVDGDNNRMIALENNMQRALHGTTDWAEQVTELDVPDDARLIVFGLLLPGDGSVHARDVRIEAVNQTLAWRTDRVAGTSPFYEVVDTSAADHALTLRRMEGGTLMDNEFGTATTSAPATAFAGRRVTVRAMMRTRDAQAASIWVRAEGAGKTLALQNNMDRPVVGTTDWTESTAVLDFPAGTETMAYGLLLLGRGSVSVRNITVSSAPITGAPMSGLPMRP